MINVPYGTMLETTFNFVGSFNNPLDFKEEKWIDTEKSSDGDEKGAFSFQVFPSSRGKTGDRFSGGFIENTNPSIFVYLVRD